MEEEIAMVTLKKKQKLEETEDCVVWQGRATVGDGRVSHAREAGRRVEPVPAQELR